jgi:hypothetical protein
VRGASPQYFVPCRDREGNPIPASPTYTKAEMLAPPLDTQPLDQLIDANARERHRLLLGQPQHSAKFHPGGIWDETNPEGRAALLDVLFPEEEP